MCVSSLPLAYFCKVCVYGTFSCSINVTLQLDTNQVRGFLFPAQAHLQWPSLVKKHKIRFPLTQIGNMSVSKLDSSQELYIYTA